MSSRFWTAAETAKVQPGAPGHIYAAEWVPVLDKPTGPVSRAMGDIHPYGNPHIWLDPYNGRMIAVKLADKLSSMDPTNAKNYRDNLTKFLYRLDSGMFGAKLVDKFGGPKLWDWQRTGVLTSKLADNNARADLGGWEAKMLPLAGRPIVTYHKSFSYFARRFDLRVVDELEPKPGLDPTPGHLATVVKTVQSAGVKVILQETFYSTRHAQLVASRTGASVVTVPQNVGHDKAATDYISLFDVIVSRVSQALK